MHDENNSKYSNTPVKSIGSKKGNPKIMTSSDFKQEWTLNGGLETQ